MIVSLVDINSPFLCRPQPDNISGLLKDIKKPFESIIRFYVSSNEGSQLPAKKTRLLQRETES